MPIPVAIIRNGHIMAQGRACNAHDLEAGMEMERDPERGIVRKTPVDEQKHKAVMDALADLIRSQLDGTERQRFACVNRLSVIGQKLMMELGPRPEDAEANADFANGDFGIGMNQYGVGNYPARGVQMIGAGNDQQQMVREMMAALGPAFGGLHDTNEAKRRESNARELNELLDARARLSLPQSVDRDGPAVEKLTKRINAILAAMEEEETPEGDEDGLRVVPTVDVRGHKVGAAQRVVDAPVAHGAGADGEVGGALVVRARDEARPAPDGVGAGG